MQACWDAAGEVIKAWATEGHSVALPGLGTMRFGLRSKSVSNVNKVATDLIQTRRIIFTPDVDLKNELKLTSISITCYDAEGNVIKRVTSEDAGEVEEENENENQGGGTNTGDNTGENQGGGTNTGDNTGGDNQGGDNNGGGDNGGTEN
jgi:hypothetical protein